MRIAFYRRPLKIAKLYIKRKSTIIEMRFCKDDGNDLGIHSTLRYHLIGSVSSSMKSLVKHHHDTARESLTLNGASPAAMHPAAKS